MSTKTSPLHAVKTPSTSSSSSSSTSSTPPPPLSTAVVAPTPTTTSLPVSAAEAMNAIKIKRELPSDEINEYAETTMKELLGWYGFDGVDRLDLSAKTSRLLQSASAACHSGGNQREQQQPQQQHHMERRNHRNRGMSGGNRVSALMQIQQQRDEILRKVTNTTNTNNNNNNNNNVNSHANNNNNNSNCGNSSRKNSFCQNYRAGVGSTDGATSDHDTHSSREDDSKSPQSTASKTALAMEEKIDLQNCCWCRRPVADNAPEFLTTSDGPRYCSESCFTQSRRASFKKAKTCDWCKHVRHAVSYVDFQDGASQLQFCSDKCLNQYKMQIFCKETQAHLDMNPHLRDQGLEAAAAGNGAGLITPDLWLRNCRSRSASPASTVSVSPGPPPIVSASSAVANIRKSPNVTSPVQTSAQMSANTPTFSSSSGPQSSHKPIISVAPVSKLMSKSPSIMAARTSPKHNRKKRQLRSSGISSVGVGVNDLHATLKSNSRELAALTAAASSGGGAASMLNNKSKSLLQVNHNTGATNYLRSSPGHMMGGVGCSSAKSTAASLSQFAGSSVQDLHMSVPPLSPMLDQQPASAHSASQMPPISLGGHASHHGSSIIPPSYFATPTTNGPTSTATPLPPLNVPYGGHRPPPPPPLFLQNHGMPQRFMGGYPTGGLPPQLPPHFMQPPTPSADFNGGLGALFGHQPPVTIMVPYPVIIPLPIPIPVPLPIKSFYKAYLSPEERLKFDEEERQRACEQAETSQSCRARVQRPNKSETQATEEPLDCTKSKDETMVKSEETTEIVDNKPEKVGESTIEGENCSSTLKAADDMSFKDGNDGNDKSDDESREKLPKFKITRLQTKRTLLIQTKESECSRPLRKRKRIIDCDFQKIALKEEADAAEESGARDPTTTMEGSTEKTPAVSSTVQNDKDDNQATPPIPVCNNNNDDK